MKEIVYRGTTINAKFIEKVIDIQSKGKINNDNITDVYLKLVAMDGIGSIYALAVIYLLTREEYPIYDRLVRNAREAIINNKKPGDKIHLSDLSLNSVPKQYLEYKVFLMNLKNLRSQIES